MDSNALYFSEPDYNSALIGLSIDGRAVYEYNLMISFLIEKFDYTYDEAIDFMEQNTIKSTEYQKNSPIIIHMN